MTKFTTGNGFFQTGYLNININSEISQQEKRAKSRHQRAKEEINVVSYFALCYLLSAILACYLLFEIKALCFHGYINRVAGSQIVKPCPAFLVRGNGKKV